MKTQKNNKKVNLKKKKLRLKFLKWTSLIVLICGAISLILLSDLFNIKEIIVKNNNRISSQEIISLSEININENMFKYLNLKVKEQIKKNAYVEEVKIHRHLNGKIEIDVQERTPTYMLKTENGYAYINNQGYILEINPEIIEVPEIEGFKSEKLETGNRLEISDLKKLNTIIQIMQSAKEKGMAEKISKVNMEKDTNILIIMEAEQKTIHFGDATNIGNKIIKIIPVLEDNVGVTGDIFVENINKVYFRGEV